MATRAELLNAVCNDPADDTVRGAYADFLDEPQDASPADRARAELIRVQIRIAVEFPVRADMCSCGRDWERVVRSSFPVPIGICRPCGRDGPPWDAVIRERLARAHQFELPALHKGFWLDEVPLLSLRNFRDDLADAPRLFSHPTFRRGFVEKVRCAGDDWARHGDALRKQTPVTEVELTSWPGWEAGHSVMWFGEDAADHQARPEHCLFWSDIRKEYVRGMTDEVSPPGAWVTGSAADGVEGDDLLPAAMRLRWPGIVFTFVDPGTSRGTAELLRIPEPEFLQILEAEPGANIQVGDVLYATTDGRVESYRDRLNPGDRMVVGRCVGIDAANPYVIRVRIERLAAESEPTR